MSDRVHSLLVLGGGVSGWTLACFTKVFHPEIRVTVVERERKAIGRILVSGNGRCNIYNRNIYENTLPEDRAFDGLRRILTPGLGKKALDTFMEVFRVPVYWQGDLCYPFSNRSDTVWQAMLDKASKLGVILESGTAIKIDRDKGGALIDAGGKKKFIQADRTAVCLGGSSLNYPAFDWNILDGLKADITPFTPALGPIPVKENLKGLEGVRIKGTLSLLDRGNRVYSEPGEILFRKKEISGICAFDCSIRIDSKRIQDFQLSLDCTAHDGEKVDLERYPLTHIFPSAFAQYLHYRSADSDLRSVASDLRFQVAGLPDFKNSQVSKGGVSLDSIDLPSFTFKSDPRFLCLGETLDASMPCGGYNIGSCIVEALSAASALK